MAMLDAPAFKTVLTPEAALGIIKQSVAAKGWQQVTVSNIKLFYTPFWILNFDVLLEGSPGESQTIAINASTGKASEYVPYLFENPLEKAKSISSGEVESTAISQNRVIEVGQAKIASMLGLKRESVTISAVSKHYVPFYRIWAEINKTPYIFNVDACLGNPLGLEQVKPREKDWKESSSETIRKMATPSGFLDLLTSTINESIKIFKGEGTGIWKNDWVRYGLLILIVAILAFLVFIPRSELSSRCFGKVVLVGASQYAVDGSCVFSNSGGKGGLATAVVAVKDSGKTVQTCPVMWFVPEKTTTGMVPINCSWISYGSHEYSLGCDSGCSWSRP